MDDADRPNRVFKHRSGYKSGALITVEFYSKTDRVYWNSCQLLLEDRLAWPRDTFGAEGHKLRTTSDVHGACCSLLAVLAHRNI